MLDIDFFKQINDTYGHPVGDKILIHIVNICKEHLRKNDYIARIGGEEFTILLPQIDKKEANLIANRIKEKIQNTPFLEEKNHIHCTVSIGCMTNTNQYSKISDIYEIADSALYSAKNSGRNLVFSI
jgi:diguanylate cyclase (GGDEF)-like protein